MTAKTPPGYIRIGKHYISLTFLLKASFIIMALVVLYSIALHPVVMQKRLELQNMPEFEIDSPYLADYTGNARLVLPGGAIVYEGSVEKASISGEGRLYDNGILVYEGGFESNDFSGYGRLYNRGVLLYEGSFIQGVYSGSGRLYDVGGALLYEGGFLAGVYDGRGQLYQNGALLYEGDFIGGMYDGIGSEYNTETGHLIFSGRYLQGERMAAGVLYDENGEPVTDDTAEALPEPRPNPLSLLGMSYADVTDCLTQAAVTVREQAAGDTLFAFDDEIAVIYGFELMDDGTPDYLQRIYYYGLTSVDGVVVGADVSDIPGGTDSEESLSAAELLVLGYANAAWSRDAAASKLKCRIFDGNPDYTAAAFYLPPEPVVISVPDASESDGTEGGPVPLEPVAPSEPSGRILFLRIDYTAK